MFKTISNLFSTTRNTIRNTFDGFVNVLTGIGTDRDKTTSFFITKSRKLSYPELDTLIRDNPIAKKICLRVSEEIMRDHLEFDIEDPETEISFKNEYSKYHALIQQALFWEFAFGGGAVILDIDDGGDLDQPVNVDSIRSLGNRLIVIDKSYLNVDGFNVLEEPELYYINLQNGTQYVHKSRMIIFKGSASTLTERQENSGFSDSKLQSLYPAIRNYTVAHDSCAAILNDFNQTVYKLDGLNDMLDSEAGEEQVIKKMLLMDRTRSVVKAVAIDKEDDFIRSVSPLQGLKEFISIFKDYLIAVSSIPHNILMGEKTEGGLSESGKTQMMEWYAYIHQNRERIKGEIDKLITYISAVEQIDKPNWKFKNLWSLDEKEEAELEAKNAESFSKYASGLKTFWDMSAISSDEMNNLVFKKDSKFSSISNKVKDLLGAWKW